MKRIVYENPSVRIIDATDSLIGHKIWCQSKSSVVHVEGGEVKIGKSVKKAADYYREITNMNMQYNNLPYFILEVNGSNLFRDLIYNINKASQWAVSLRLLHSVRDRHDIANYVISGEYEGIKEWEDAFYKYFDVVQEESRTDKNRITMPYSIKSTYWIGINFKSIVNLLTMMKLEMPFFYKVYGKLIAAEMNKYMPYNTTIEEFYGNEVNSAVSKYFTKNDNEFKEECIKVDDYYLVKQEMGLILYSQFIRQADVEVKGLWDMLRHEDPEVFSHKVFTGNTIIKTTYLAHVDRVATTVRNRTCFFSQSDGDENDPNYWSMFLSTFLSGIESVDEFKEILPCRFCGHKMVQCKYKEDVTFRDEGLQEGYIPCPILNANYEYAEKRYKECSNKLNDWYRKVTADMINRGLNYEWGGEYWTSKLIIKTKDVLSDEVIKSIIDELKYIEERYSSFVRERKPDDLAIPMLSDEYKKYGLNDDYTCMLKGLAIDRITKLLSGYDSFIINFGGDMFIKNASARVRIDGTKFSFDVTGTYSIFTSGNTAKRGDHIVGPEVIHGAFNTLLINWSTHDPNNTAADISCTKYFADHQIDDFLRNQLGDYRFFIFTEDGTLLSNTYCASPFFNDEQIQIRDNMISHIKDPFRPDLTPASLEYNDNKNDESVEAVFQSNIDGIKECEYLVFPNHTNDLGTLYEVGRALALNHPILKYQESKDEYIIIWTTPKMQFDDDKDYLFDCSKKIDAIGVGFASMRILDEHIYYELNGCNDNIMLSLKYNHVEKEGENYVKQFRDPSDRDI